LLPLIGSSGKKKKVKDGAGLARLGSAIYTQKGNNTREFWTFATASGWDQLDDVPLGGSKQVKGGGGLTASAEALYELKGNNTVEFWRYVPVTGDQAALPDAGEQAQTAERRQLTGASLSVAPNPFTGRGTVSFSLPAVGVYHLRLYEVSGRLVQNLGAGQGRSGVHQLGVGAELANGVYLIRLDCDYGAMTRKLVVE
jgi:hypothetical protein